MGEGSGALGPTKRHREAWQGRKVGLPSLGQHPHSQTPGMPSLPWVALILDEEKVVGSMRGHSEQCRVDLVALVWPNCLPSVGSTRSASRALCSVGRFPALVPAPRGCEGSRRPSTLATRVTRQSSPILQDSRLLGYRKHCFGGGLGTVTRIKIHSLPTQEMMWKCLHGVPFQAQHASGRSTLLPQAYRPRVFTSLKRDFTGQGRPPQ